MTMLSVNKSTYSLNAQRQLNKSSKSLGVSLERLSSGLKINSARDDAAGLAITNQMTAQTRGLQKSVQNSTDWISLLQTADGALNEMTNILQRVRELAVQAVNDTNNDSDRNSLNEEVEQLVAALDRIAKTTNFNGVNLLNGGVTDLYMQMGANSGEDERFSIRKLDIENLGRGQFGGPQATEGVDPNLGFNNLAFRVNGEIYNIRDSVAEDDTVSTTLAANSVIAKAAAINASSDQHGVRMRVLGAQLTSDSAINATTLDADTYIEINDVKFSGFAFQDNDADGSLTDSINAATEETGVVASVSEEGELVLFTEDGRNIALSVQGFGGAFAGQADNSTEVQGGAFRTISREGFEFRNNTVIGGDGNNHALGGVSNIPIIIALAGEASTAQRYDVSNQFSALRTLDTIEFAFADVNEVRSQLGAQQNRLESTIANLQVAHENLSAAKSRISDVDFAEESAQLARNQIIQQAGVSILSQANQSLSIALSLLNQEYFQSWSCSGLQ